VQVSNGFTSFQWQSRVDKNEYLVWQIVPKYLSYQQLPSPQYKSMLRTY